MPRPSITSPHKNSLLIGAEPEAPGKAIDRRHNLVAFRHRKAAAPAEVALDIHEQQHMGADRRHGESKIPIHEIGILLSLLEFPRDLAENRRPLFRIAL